ncbi:MAG: ATP-grasp domain-containing protein, partial [Zetaproteobacteria bacterium]|nr:ATP-grasp domain-containing protein [Zetaproteobacteria bacterium]
MHESRRIGFPLMIRPSFVLGGRAMKVVYSEEELLTYIQESVDVSQERPVLIDRFLDDAIDFDVDAVRYCEQVIISGVLEHIEPALVHSGDSSCCMPPQSLSNEVVQKVCDNAVALAKALKVVGLLNVQCAVKDGTVYILEANPRASRTVPFVSKATGVPWAKVAARLMVGKKLHTMNLPVYRRMPYFSVKESVFPFNKFRGVDTILGPEMKSTGEVMGIHSTFAGAFAKGQFAANVALPQESGKVFLSVKDSDKRVLLPVAQRLADLGYILIATQGTSDFLCSQGLAVESINKVREGSPHVVDLLG